MWFLSHFQTLCMFCCYVNASNFLCIFFHSFWDWDGIQTQFWYPWYTLLLLFPYYVFLECIQRYFSYFYVSACQITTLFCYAIHFMKTFSKNASLNFLPCRQRLELMREMYQNEAEVSPSSPDPSTASKDINLNADPFYDRFPWYVIFQFSIKWSNRHEFFF